MVLIKMDSGGDCVFYFEECHSNRKKLFEEAINRTRIGRVLYIMKEELNELPQLSQDISCVDRHYMRMISFLYAETLESLIEGISSLPDWQYVPSTIILEDLNLYCDNDKIQNACGVVAFFIDTVRVCGKVINTPCKLFVSVSKDAEGGGVNDNYCDILKELYSFKE